MRDGFAFILLLMRTGAAILLTLGLVAFLLVVYVRDGVASLAEAFQVLQGLLLSTLAYLFTVHAADRAEATVLAEKRKRAELEGLAREEAGGVEDLKARLERAHRILVRLEQGPAVGRRVKGLTREIADEDAP